MAYVDGFVVAVPKARVEDYKAPATRAGQVGKEYGALTVPAVKSPVVSITSGPGTTVICSG